MFRQRRMVTCECLDLQDVSHIDGDMIISHDDLFVISTQLEIVDMIRIRGIRQVKMST